ncbi:endonuclease domain-containing protein [Thiomonas sp.]
MGRPRSTHCPAGHPYDEANTYLDSRGRQHCRVCRRQRSREYAARNPEKMRERATRRTRERTRTAAQQRRIARADYLREYQRRWRETHREHQREYNRKHREATATRPRPDACEVCGRSGGARALHKDHDHSHCRSGCKECFRGWLCSGCNVALGHAGDSPQRLRLLAAYIERFAP